MAKKQKVSPQEFYQLDNYLYAAEIGNLDAVKRFAPEGDDIYYGYGCDGNALDRATYCNQLPVARYLLDELGFGSNPQLVGKALICATTADSIMLLANYNPDCSVTTKGGLSPRDVYICLGEYDSIRAYDECGLPLMPVNRRFLRRINGRCDLRQWSLIHNIKVPDEYYQRLADFAEAYPYPEKAKKQRLFKKITREVLIKCAR